jgi:hypothetical protein
LYSIKKIGKKPLTPYVIYFMFVHICFKNKTDYSLLEDKEPEGEEEIPKLTNKSVVDRFLEVQLADVVGQHFCKYFSTTEVLFIEPVVARLDPAWPKSVLNRSTRSIDCGKGGFEFLLFWLNVSDGLEWVLCASTCVFSSAGSMNTMITVMSS